MCWEYADLSKSAKQNGGPEKYINILIESGKKSVYPWVGTAFVGGVASMLMAQKVIQYFKEKHAVSQKAVESAKAELINGIKAYDEAQLGKQADISFCYNCGAVISDQPDYNDCEEIAVCSKCGTENKKMIGMSD